MNYWPQGLSIASHGTTVNLGGTTAEASYWAEVTVREQRTLSLPPRGGGFSAAWTGGRVVFIGSRGPSDRDRDDLYPVHRIPATPDGMQRAHLRSGRSHVASGAEPGLLDLRT